MEEKTHTQKPEQKKENSPEEVKYLVRVCNTDLKGEKTLLPSLNRIKGVGFMFSNMICRMLGIDPGMRVGKLSDEQVEKIEKIIANPASFGAPSWMLNRRKDYEDGKDKHLQGADIGFVVTQDIKRMQKIRAYKGFRHAAGLPLRGQRTRSNFRRSKSRGKGGIGVQRKKVAPKKSGAKPAAPAKGKK